MTTGELIALLAEYPADTPVFDGRGYDLHATSISEQTYDVWTGVVDEDGYETPDVGVGVSIGRRY